MTSDERTVEFRAPSKLLDRADALATVFESDREEILVEALGEYLRDVKSDDELVQEIAGAYYDDELSFEQLESLVGAEDATDFRTSKQQLGDDSTDALADIE